MKRFFIACIFLLALFSIHAMKLPKEKGLVTTKEKVAAATDFLDYYNMSGEGINCTIKCHYALAEAILLANYTDMAKAVHAYPPRGKVALLNKQYPYTSDTNYPQLSLFLKYCKSQDSFMPFTPLELAIHAPNIKVITMLSALGVDFAFSPNTPLHQAIMCNKPEAIAPLIKRGMRIHEPFYVLPIAIQKEKPAAVKALLDAGASVKTDANGCNVLALACEIGNREILSYLFANALVSLNEPNEHGIPPLLLHLRKSPVLRQLSQTIEDDRTHQLLLDYGADITAVCADNNKTVLDHLSHSSDALLFSLFLQGAPRPWGFSSPVAHRLQKTIREHLEPSTTEFYTKYFEAVSFDDTYTALHLIRNAKADQLNQKSLITDQLSPLHWAVIRNNKEVMQALLARSTLSKIKKIIYENFPFAKFRITTPVDSNARDAQGRTALMWAARLGYTSLYNALVKAGAKRMITDNKGRLALHYAAIYANVDIIRHMLEEEPNVFRLLSLKLEIPKKKH